MTTLLTNARVAPCVDGLELLDGDTVAFDDGLVTFVGWGRDAPRHTEVIDLGGRLVTPGLVDCHTHLVWAGDRLEDFRRRTGGETYAQMAQSGGGILSTVEATRTAGESALVREAVQRLGWLAAGGVTTAEVKSGYGMDTEAEIRMLRAAIRAGAQSGVRVETTLLGAHALPQGRSRREQVEAVVGEMIPAVAAGGLAAAVDVFADSIAFTAEEAAQIFEAAAAAGLAVKAHVGQLADIGAAEVAARYEAISIDHCEHVPESAMDSLADAGTVAVLVPGASVFLGEPTLPPVSAFRERGIRMAVTTDLNPGSSPLASLTTAAALAVHRFGLTADEAVLGITAHAADALRLEDGRGRIVAGGVADLAVWNLDEPTELAYWLSAPACAGVVIGGSVRMNEEW